MFSDGIASVEESGKIKFIDTEGKLAFDRTFKYNPNHRGHVFHGGYYVIDENQDKKYGLMNTKRLKPDFPNIWLTMIMRVSSRRTDT